MSEHVCQPVYDDDGNLIATVLADPDMDDVARGHLAKVIEAARRLAAAEAEADPTRGERQAAAIRRIRERNARLRGQERSS